MRKETDFLVIGSGIAGLMYALKVSDYGSVCLVSKSSIDDTNTNHAQGGIATVTYKPDSEDKHIEDTLKAGDGLCDKKVVKMVVSEGHEMIQKLIEYGTQFDKNPQGEFDLAKEGGHSEHRVLHYKDKTGFEIQRALVEQVKSRNNIEIFENYFAVDIITQHHMGYAVIRNQTPIECYGAYVMNVKNNQVDTILAKTTYLATGGIGNIYHTTTNPQIATGDGIAMVYRAKGEIENMEFVQFHPTALYNIKDRPSFLITEAMRGFGAKLLTIEGERFMQKYDSRNELASRDIVARAIDNELKISGAEHVFLDCTHIPKDDLLTHFPNIYEKCKEIGIDITKEYIPVVPAAHYVCGGIKVNKKGKTSIKNLYAGGEAASTGLHGANRLASNSLLEAVVFANNSAKSASKKISEIKINYEIPDWNDEGTIHLEEMVLITQEFKELQQIMTNYVGIVRSDLRLKRALARLEIISRETEKQFNKSKLSEKICQLRNAVNVAYLIIQMAAARKESRGLHYNIDYPEKGKLI